MSWQRFFEESCARFLSGSYSGDYESARRNYGRALSRTRSLEDKVDLYFKLADVFTQTQDWQGIRTCWQGSKAKNCGDTGRKSCRVNCLC